MRTIPSERDLSIENLYADYGERAKRRRESFSASVLRTKTTDALEITARLATDSKLDSDQFLRVVSTEAPNVILELMTDTWWALEHMRIGALMLVDTKMYKRALRLYNILAPSTDIAADRNHLTFYLQIASILGASTDALALMADPRLHSHYRASTLSDLLNPFHKNPTGQDIPTWMRAFGLALGRTPDDRLKLMSQGISPIDRLSSDCPDQIQQGQRISVITSTYNPDQSLLTAIRSIKSQTWQNWEMLVVDDASDTSTAPILDTAERLDTRVRVIRKAVNGGTYRARNTALQLAQGDFITFLDSDDWAHPRFLEDSVQPLLESPSLVATTGWGARVTPELLTTRLGFPTIVPAATTLMIRSPNVIDRIGFYDPVRKGADTEYAERLMIAFGQKIHTLKKSASILIRTGPPTLSASDFSKGWRHSSRRAYRMGYQQWHSEIESGASDPYLHPDEPRRFPAPARWTDAARRHFDVVIAGDWRQFGGPQRSMLEEIRACREAGFTVGIMQFDALRFMSQRDTPLCQPIRVLINDGAVEWVHFDDDVTVASLLLRYPPVLQFQPSRDATFTPDNLFIVANQAPAEPDGSDQRYIPQTVSKNAEKMFGIAPVWVPQGPSIRAALQSASKSIKLTSWNNPGLIRVDEWSVPSLGSRTSAPVVGRYSRDNGIKFPRDGRDLVVAYNFPDQYQVRMMGATRTVPHLLASVGATMPTNWTLLPQGAIDVREFLKGLDYFVYIDNAEANEAFGRVLLEAAASGVLTIASPKHRPTFGDALLYAAPHEVVEMVRSFPLGSREYARQSRHSQDIVRRQFSHEFFADKLRGYVAEPNSLIGARSDRELDGGSTIRVDLDPRTGLKVSVGAAGLVVRSVRSDIDGAISRQVAVVTQDGSQPTVEDAAGIVQIMDQTDRTGPAPGDLEELSAVFVRDKSALKIWTRRAHHWSDISMGSRASLLGVPDTSGSQWLRADIEASVGVEHSVSSRRV